MLISRPEKSATLDEPVLVHRVSGARMFSGVFGVFAYWSVVGAAECGLRAPWWFEFGELLKRRGGWPISSITSATSSGLSRMFTCEHPYALHPRFSCQHSSCTTSPHAEHVCAASVGSIFHWQMLQM